MTQAQERLDVVVERVADAARDIRVYDLARPDRAPLPAYAPGAHVDLVLGDHLVRSYSLVGPLDDRMRYRVAVQLDPASRGGSAWCHARLGVGTPLRISPPRNHFALVEDAPASWLFAGGIGITPLYCMVQRLAALGRPWQLHYACRTRAAAAFVDEIEALARASGGTGRLHLWCDDEHGGQPLALAPLVRSAPVDAHLYCCGPAPMLAAFRDAAAGEDSERVHMEYFRPLETVQPQGGFTVALARTGVEVEVPAGCSILDALMMNGIDAPYSCYEGVCGTCETTVLEGVPEHRDCLLTEQAKAEGKRIIICRSGSRTPRLVLDL